MVKRRLPDSVKIALARWWFVGALYFFLAFGSPWGTSSGALDLILFLCGGIGIAMAFIFNPVVKAMFGPKQEAKTRSLMAGVGNKLAEIVWCSVVVLLVSATYQGINSLWVQLRDLPADTIVLKGEPFLFATFFMIYYQVSKGLAAKIRQEA
jgi:uncharacterized membrane protein